MSCHRGYPDHKYLRIQVNKNNYSCIKLKLNINNRSLNYSI
jgi:hypothetical protein